MIKEAIINSDRKLRKEIKFDRILFAVVGLMFSFFCLMNILSIFQHPEKLFFNIYMGIITLIFGIITLVIYFVYMEDNISIRHNSLLYTLTFKELINEDYYISQYYMDKHIDKKDKNKTEE